MSKVHCVKCWPPHYSDMVAGRKLFDWRKNDRDYQVGDIVVQQEFLPDPQKYTGEMCAFEVIHMVGGGKFAIPLGYCIMSVRRCETPEDVESLPASIQQTK